MNIMEDVDLCALSFGRQRQSSTFSSNSLDLKDVFLSSAENLYEQKHQPSNNDSWPRLSITTSQSIDNRSIKENQSVKLGGKSNSLSSYPSSNNGNSTEALKKLINHAPLVLPAKLSSQFSAPPPLERPKLQLSKNSLKIYDNFANNNMNDLDKVNVNDRENSDFGDEEDDVFLQYTNENAKKRRDDYRKSTSSSAGLSGTKLVNSLKKVRFAMSMTAGKNDGEDCVKFGGLSTSGDDSELETSEMRVGGDKSGDKFLLKTMPRRGCCPCQRAIAWLVYLLVINFCMITIVLLFLYIPETFRRIVNGPLFGKNRKSISACHEIEFSYFDNITLPNIYPTSSVKVFDDRSSKSILFGYGSLSIRDLPCENRKTCQHRGGVICLKITGARSFEEKWRLLTVNEVTSINCYHDVDNDGISDCILGGKSGILKLINGKNGTIMWEFLTIAGSNRRVLEPQLVNDLDADGFADILVTVDTEIEDKYEMMLYLISHKTGRAIASSANVLTVSSMKTETPSITCLLGIYPTLYGHLILEWLKFSKFKAYFYEVLRLFDQEFAFF
uniref:FAM234A/B beta-propeller domain-containing protein n=1 Tax=Romanomermis culicivorax TaxID=13658 RepID=A0A915HI41_ROMCU